MADGTENADARGTEQSLGAAARNAEEWQAALTAAETAAAGSRDQYLRAVAELDNVRKRAQRDVENAHRYGLERFAQELLPVRDSLELAVAAGSQDGAAGGEAGLREGLAATLKLLRHAFDKLSIVQINPQGERFDPAQHEAVLAQESASAAPDSVLQVVQSGYSLNGRLLRPARVIVARPPETAANAARTT